MQKLAAKTRIAMTEKRSATNFSSADHGTTPELSRRSSRKPTGRARGSRGDRFRFTTQDGNSLASSIAAALWIIEPDFDRERLSVLDRFFFREI